MSLLILPPNVDIFLSRHSQNYSHYYVHEISEQNESNDSGKRNVGKTKLYNRVPFKTTNSDIKEKQKKRG